MMNFAPSHTKVATIYMYITIYTTYIILQTAVLIILGCHFSVNAVGQIHAIITHQ